jgi:cobalamin-dependent methionine synthase I
MQIIANNITTRNPRIASILRESISGGKDRDIINCPGLKDVAESCLAAGADILEINLQQRDDNPQTMEFAVKVIQQYTECQLCLSSNSAAALEAGLKVCHHIPIVNYIAIETGRLREIFPLVIKYNTEVIFLASDPVAPADARQMLEKAAVLMGAANSSGITNDRIFLDPGLIHVNKDPGQRHLEEVFDFLQNVPETFGSQVRTTCWISNSSAGVPARLRPVIEIPLLAMLSGQGLSSVFLDILRPENKRAIHLLKIFRNEEVYADEILSL